MEYDLAKIKLVAFDFDGVFTDNTVYVDQSGVESVRCWRGDGLGLEMLRQRGIQLAVISTETNSVVQSRCEKLKIRCISGVSDKAASLRSLADELAINLNMTCFLGNDRNDIPALEIVGFPAIVADADKSVKHLASIKTQLMGGRGAVRELCELITTAIDQREVKKL